MKQRTKNENYHQYKYWGGRGIGMSSEWETFTAFKEWLLTNLGERPGEDFSFDRIDNDDDYKPGNVRWTDKSTQVANTRVRSDNKSGYKGVYFSKGYKWLAQMTYNKQYYFLGFFDDKEEAIHVRKDWERQLHNLS
jgi:hypothetical protein